MFYDSSISLTAVDDDNDDTNGEEEEKEEEPIIEAGDYNLGDDIGERIGEGHDSEAEPV